MHDSAGAEHNEREQTPTKPVGSERAHRRAVMRGSAVYNWRQTPLVTRGKNGEIKRNKVTYTTPGYLFYD